MKLTASDRKSLIRLASSMEKGSRERKVILAGIQKSAGHPVGDRAAVNKETRSLLKNWVAAGNRDWRKLVAKFHQNDLSKAHDQIGDLEKVLGRMRNGITDLYSDYIQHSDYEDFYDNLTDSGVEDLNTAIEEAEHDLTQMIDRGWADDGYEGDVQREINKNILPALKRSMSDFMREYGIPPRVAKVTLASERSAYSGGPGQYGDATEDPSIYQEEEVDPCESNPEYADMSLEEVYECAPDAVDDWTEAGEGVMAGLKRLGFKVREGKDWHEDGRLGMEIFIQGPLGKAQIDIQGNIDPKGKGQLKRGWGLYTAIMKGADWWDFKHLKHGEVEMDGGNVRRFVKKVLDVWADGGLKRTRKASSKASAERVTAAFLKQGSGDLHKEWQAAYRLGMGDLQKRWTGLLNKAGRQFKKDDWKLEPQSWLGYYNHGSDGARMDGKLMFEDLRNEARGRQETEDWLEANLGLSYNLTGRSYGKWSLSLEE